MKKASLTTHSECILENDIFWFDLVRGMDYRDRYGNLVFADPNVDKDFHNNKRQPKKREYNSELNEDRSFWYFHANYNKDCDFRATKFKTEYGQTVSVRHFHQHRLPIFGTGDR